MSGFNWGSIRQTTAAFIKKARGNKALTAATWAVFALTPLYLALTIEWFNFRRLIHVTTFISGRPLNFLFSVILVYIIFTAFFLLARRMWAAAAVCGILSIAVSLVNYYKYSLTGDNFYPRDISLSGDLGTIAGFVSVPLPGKAVLLIALTAVLIAYMAVFGKSMAKKVKWFITLPASAAIFTAIVVFFSNAASAGKVFNKFGILYESAAYRNSAYMENGFIAAFSIGVAQFGITQPDGYSLRTLEDALAGFEASGPDSSYLYPDIVLVLSESFWDPRELPHSVFSENPMPNYDRLIKSGNTLSGKVLVSTMGGGTIRSEFEILTGLSIEALPAGIVPYDIIRSSIPTYVTRYKDMGYDAIAIHPYMAKFYNRDVCLPFLGFDDFWGVDRLTAIPSVEAVISGHDIGDWSFVEYLKHFLDNQGENPLFLFGISMEGHQPYSGKYASFDIHVENERLGPDDSDRFSNYTQAIKNMDAALGSLAEYIDNRQRPTVLLWFGDHLPSIMVDYSSYLDSGYIDASWQEEDRIKMLTPPFLMYANFPLDKGMFPGNENNEVSAYNLLNALSRSTGGGQTALMRLLEELHNEAPFYNRRIGVAPGDYAAGLVRLQHFATYNAITGN